MNKQDFEKRFGLSFETQEQYEEFKHDFYAVVNDLEIGIDETGNLFGAYKWFKTPGCFESYGTPQQRKEDNLVPLEKVLECVLYEYLPTIVEDFQIKRIPKCLYKYMERTI